MNTSILKKHQQFSGTVEFREHDSALTKTAMRFALYLPPGEIKGGLIWLSGLTCTEENFITKACAQKYLAEHGLVLIAPDTSPRGLDLPGEHDTYDFGSGAGFYLNATTDGYTDHYRMYSYINEELYDWFNSEFNLRGRIGIFGHSMGGHGALTIGLKNPAKYRSISAFSPIVNPMECDWGRKAFTGYLESNRETWREYDACELLKSGKTHANSILIDQGLADDFYPDQLLTKNIEAIAKETGQSLEVHYREAYDHSYYFISTFIEEHIQFHAKTL